MCPLSQGHIALRPTDIQTSLTQERLKSLLRYEPETGVFTWRVDRTGGIKAGDGAGVIDKGRRRIKIDGVMYFGHRLAWLYMTGEWPAHLVDHKDTDEANDAWRNLRAASHAENMRNKNASKNSRSGLKGVRKSRKKWAAQIRIDGVLKHLGTFINPEEARAAYTKAAEANFGQFARS